MSFSRWNPWRGLGALPPKIWIHFTATLVNRMGTMAIPFLVLYLTKDVGFTAEHAGLMLSLYGLGSLVASPFMGKLADRVGPVLVMKASLVCSAGFITTVQPAASAGPSFQACMSSGKFHGMICPTTPTGSWRV